MADRTRESIRLSAIVLLAGLMGCESVAQLPGGPRNVLLLDDFRLEMEWCEIRADRNAECELRVTSLRRDMKAGLAYPMLQDSNGNEYRMATKDGSTGGKLMMVGQPYVLNFVASNLPVDATAVRGVHGSFVVWTADTGLLASQSQAVFTGIPGRPAAAQAASTQPAVVPRDPPVAGALPLANTYWRGVIVPVVAVPESELIERWKRGAYLHMREDGLIGFNWSKPGTYLYLDANFWRQGPSTFTLSMGGANYTFDAKAEPTLTTFLDEGGGFKMTLSRKAADQD